MKITNYKQKEYQKINRKSEVIDVWLNIFQIKRLREDQRRIY